ncbi:MAG: hypothetical protein HOP10_16980 [Chitinophagaceae bacterium]|nr:hypothetical protein [Chitinophagaceae bacterium]
MDENDTLHQNALDYFQHFLDEKITIHLSTVAVAEYTVVDDADNLPLHLLQIEAFDFKDATTAGKFHGEIYGKKANVEGYNRRIIANDVKILAQTFTKQVDAIITKDVDSYSKYVKPLSNAGLLQIVFLDLNTSLSTRLGQLF